MDNYETEVARQPGGPFNSPKERRTIRLVAERWVERQRYAEERKRRLTAYGWWLGLAAPVALAAVKLVEAVLWK